MDQLKTITYETTGRIARITLNRPERGNGITLDMPAEIAACVERANLDPSVHVIALAGNGKGFCGGYDLVLAAEHGFSADSGSTAPEGSPEVSTISVRLWVVTQAAVRSQYHPRERGGSIIQDPVVLLPFH